MAQRYNVRHVVASAVALILAAICGCGSKASKSSKSTVEKNPPDEPRPDEEGEGARGYLTSPRDIVLEVTSAGQIISIKGPPKSVTATLGLESQLSVQVIFASVSALQSSTLERDADSTIKNAVPLASLKVQDDGSFFGDVRHPGQGAIFLTLDPWERGAVLELKKLAKGVPGSTAFASTKPPGSGVTLAVTSGSESGELISVLEGFAEDGALSINGKGIGYAKVGASWAEVMTAVQGGLPPYRYSFVANPSDAVIDVDTGLISFTPGTAGETAFSVRVTDVEGSTSEFQFVVVTAANSLCVWNGSTSSEWAAPQNWSFCNGATPQPDDVVGIDGSATVQPVLAVDATIRGVGPSAFAGGTLTINANAKLTLLDTTNTVQSSITFQGATTTCRTCWVWGGDGGDFVVNHGATVTFGNGVSINVFNTLRIGDGVTGATWKTVSSADRSYEEYPVLTLFGGSSDHIKVQGSSTESSAIDLDGLSIRTRGFTKSSLVFVDRYAVDNLKNITFIKSDYDAEPTIMLGDCSTARFDARRWDNLNFIAVHAHGSPTPFNVSASHPGCAGAAAITVSGDGSAFGSQFEDDPYNIVNWANDTSVTCTWVGAASAVWEDPANWSGCDNGRNNLPGSADWVIIPAAAVQPVVTSRQAIQGFGLGVGGGSITLSNMVPFFVLNQDRTVRSAVTLKGVTPDCQFCHIMSYGSLSITDGATLTLDRGANIGLATTAILGSDFVVLNVGDGMTNGHFIVTGGPTASEWPDIVGYRADGVVVHGTAADKSSVSVSGVYIRTHTAFAFVDNYRIDGFDSVVIAPESPDQDLSLRLVNCNNGVFTDSTWTGLVFEAPYTSGGRNVDATACTGGSSIAIQGATGTGGGEAFEADPNGVITWN